MGSEVSDILSVDSPRNRLSRNDFSTNANTNLQYKVLFISKKKSE